MSNFTSVKLILPCLTLACFTLFAFPENCAAAQRNLVQIAALRIPFDIKDFNSKKDIDDHVPELRYDYRVGDMTEDIIKVVPLPIDEESLCLEGKEQISGFTDSLYQLLEFKEGINSNKEISSRNKSGDHFATINLIHIIFSKDKLNGFKNDLTNYGNNHIPAYLRNIYFMVVDTCFQFPVIIFFLGLILFFVINIISVLLILSYSIKKKNQNERYVKIYSKMYEEAMLSYIFGEISWEMVMVKLKKIIRNQNRKILISILLNLHENLKGEVDKFIPDIFSRLGLYNDSLKAAKSSITYKKVQGIRELTYLYPQKAIEIVPGLINYPDDVVRAEAQMAYIRLNENNPFEFLSSLTRSITRWTQLSAFYTLHLYQLPVPSFADYLYSKHPTVRNFCLQMITYFQQLENVSEVFNMMKSGKERTRFLSYKAINDLRLYDGRNLIIQSYKKETTKNKLEIIKAFKNIGSEEDFEFLEEVVKSESVSLKTEACRSMYFMNSEGRERLTKLSSESLPELKSFIAHVTDPRN